MLPGPMPEKRTSRAESCATRVLEEGESSENERAGAFVSPQNAVRVTGGVSLYESAWPSPRSPLEAGPNTSKAVERSSKLYAYRTRPQAAGQRARESSCAAMRDDERPTATGRFDVLKAFAASSHTDTEVAARRGARPI